MFVSNTTRAAIVKYVAESTNYDADTVRISKHGEVSAVLDANKTFNGPHTERLVLGTVAELLAAAA